MKVLVTGASSGIGKAVADLYEGKGHEVIRWSRRTGQDVGVLSFWLDLEKNSIDRLFLNAGIAFFDAYKEFENRERLIATNFLGVYYGLCFGLSFMKDGGVICVTSSVSAYKSEWEEPLYAAMKAAVSSLVRSCGIAYLKEGKNVRIFGVAPGFVRTNLGNQQGQIPQELIDKVPVKRAMEPEEMAKYIYLLAEEFDYLTANDVIIDGGYRWV